MSAADSTISKSKSKSPKDLFGWMLEKEFGLSTEVGVGLQIFKAYETFQDVNLDIDRFYDRKKEFESVQKVLTDIQPIKRQLEELGKNADPGTLQTLYNQIKEKMGADVASYDEARKQFESLDKQYNKLGIIFKNSETMQREADNILQQRRVGTILQLMVTYSRLISSYYKLKQNTKSLNYVETQLNDLKIKYLQPIIDQVERINYLGINNNNSNNQNSNNNNNNNNNDTDNSDNDEKNDTSNNNNGYDEISEQKLMRRIAFVQGRLEALKITIAKEKENAKTERNISAIEAVFSGLNFAASVCQIRALSGIASSFQIGLQTGIAAAQGTAALGHGIAAVYAHCNVQEWERIENDVETILMRINQLEKELLQ